MRVICLEDSWTNRDNAILVKKDCIYHITEVRRETICPPKGRVGSIWYKLLETGPITIHHSSLFAIAPDEENEKYEEENQGNFDYSKQGSLEN